MNRAAAHAERSELDSAITDYDTAIRINPAVADAFYGRGLVRFRMKELEKAIADFDRSIQLNPADALAFYWRGYTWRTQGERDKAIADYTQAITLNPGKANVYIHRSGMYFQKSEYEKAISDLREAIRLEPGNAYAHNAIAWNWTFCRDPEFRDGKQALESATTACELSEWKVAPFIETLAAAYAESGDLASAAKWQTKANALYADSNLRNQGEARLLHYLLRPGALDLPEARKISPP